MVSSGRCICAIPGESDVCPRCNPPAATTCAKCGHLWGAYEDACHCAGPCHNRDACNRKIVLAIVGSTQLAGNELARGIIDGVLFRYKPDLVISGEAKGIDLMAKYAALDAGIPYQGYPPKVKNWELGFKPRNMLIAQHCTHLVRIASAKAKTYGSGWTRDYAAKIGKFTEEFVI